MRVSVFIWSRFRWFSYLSWFCSIYLGDYNKPGQFIFASLCLSFHRAFLPFSARKLSQSRTLTARSPTRPSSRLA